MIEKALCIKSPAAFKSSLLTTLLIIVLLFIFTSHLSDCQWRTQSEILSSFFLHEPEVNFCSLKTKVQVVFFLNNQILSIHLLLKTSCMYLLTYTDHLTFKYKSEDGVLSVCSVDLTPAGRGWWPPTPTLVLHALWVYCVKVGKISVNRSDTVTKDFQKELCRSISLCKTDFQLQRAADNSGQMTNSCTWAEAGVHSW